MLSALCNQDQLVCMPLFDPLSNCSMPLFDPLSNCSMSLVNFVLVAFLEQ